MASPRRGITGIAGQHGQVRDAFVQCDLEKQTWDYSQGPVRPAGNVPTVRLRREWGGQAIGENIDAHIRHMESVQLSRCDAGPSDMVVVDFMRQLRVQPLMPGRPPSAPREALTAAIERILPDQPVGVNQFVRADSRGSSARIRNNNMTICDQLTSANQSARAASRGSSNGRQWSQNRTDVTLEFAPVLEGNVNAIAKNADLPTTTSHVRRACDPMFRAMQASDQARSVASRGFSCSCPTHCNSMQRRETVSLGPTAWARTPKADVKSIRHRGPRPAFAETVGPRQTFQELTAAERWPYPFDALVNKRQVHTRPMWWLMGQADEAAAESLPDETWDPGSEMASLFAVPHFVSETGPDETRVPSSKKTMSSHESKFTNLERAFTIYAGSR